MASHLRSKVQTRWHLDQIAAFFMIALGGRVIPADATTDSASFAVTATVPDVCSVTMPVRGVPMGRCGAEGVMLATAATITLTREDSDTQIVTIVF